ncbi:two-partner secretion domain-containing protein, partial [Aeromonas hydrophila]|uniref:two-partner secretion domain-containing protein n=1 Tax=Aeromonas hydrophila TaxID=644 RepID=UPI001269A2FD
MNKHCYRHVFCHRLGTLIVVSELARAHTGGQRVSRGRRGGFALPPVSLLAWGLWAALSGAPAWADVLPVGGQVMVGSATFDRNGNKLTVNQASDRLGVDWQSFNIASGRAVEFIQPGADSLAVNRVLGTEKSTISGSLTANGQVFLLNPNGVLFTQGAQVNVRGLVASSLTMTDKDLNNGANRLSVAPGVTGGEVINQGVLQSLEGGYVVLAGQTVRNHQDGQIITPQGRASLVAGETVTLALDKGALLNVTVDKTAAAAALAENAGLIRATDGSIQLTARGTNSLADLVVNNTGTLQAERLTLRDGEITLDGEGGLVASSGTVSSGAGQLTLRGQHTELRTGSNVTAGTLTLNAADKVNITGTVRANSGGTQNLTATGAQVTLARADIDTQGGVLTVSRPADAGGTTQPLTVTITDSAVTGGAGSTITASTTGADAITISNSALTDLTVAGRSDHAGVRLANQVTLTNTILEGASTGDDGTHKKSVGIHGHNSTVTGDNTSVLRGESESGGANNRPIRFDGGRLTTLRMEGNDKDGAGIGVQLVGVQAHDVSLKGQSLNGRGVAVGWGSTLSGNITLEGQGASNGVWATEGSTTQSGSSLTVSGTATQGNGQGVDLTRFVVTNGETVNITGRGGATGVRLGNKSALQANQVLLDGSGTTNGVTTAAPLTLDTDSLTVNGVATAVGGRGFDLGNATFSQAARSITISSAGSHAQTSNVMPGGAYDTTVVDGLLAAGVEHATTFFRGLTPAQVQAVLDVPVSGDWVKDYRGAKGGSWAFDYAGNPLVVNGSANLTGLSLQNANWQVSQNLTLRDAGLLDLRGSNMAVGGTLTLDGGRVFLGGQDNARATVAAHDMAITGTQVNIQHANITAREGDIKADINNSGGALTGLFVGNSALQAPEGTIALTAQQQVTSGGWTHGVHHAAVRVVVSELTAGQHLNLTGKTKVTNPELGGRGPSGVLLQTMALTAPDITVDGTTDSGYQNYSPVTVAGVAFSGPAILDGKRADITGVTGGSAPGAPGVSFVNMDIALRNDIAVNIHASNLPGAKPHPGMGLVGTSNSYNHTDPWVVTGAGALSIVAEAHDTTAPAIRLYGEGQPVSLVAEEGVQFTLKGVNDGAGPGVAVNPNFSLSEIMVTGGSVSGAGIDIAHNSTIQGGNLSGTSVSGTGLSIGQDSHVTDAEVVGQSGEGAGVILGEAVVVSDSGVRGESITGTGVTLAPHVELSGDTNIYGQSVTGAGIEKDLSVNIVDELVSLVDIWTPVTPV